MREKKAKKLLKQVKKNYDIIAEEFSETRNYIGKEFDHLLPFLKEARQIVDIGCGNGRFAGFIKEKNLSCKYLGIDNSTRLIQIAKEKHPHQFFMEGDQLDLPVDNEATDLILCIRTFHHLPSSRMRRKALSEMSRVLKPNGILIISVWNLWQNKYWKELTKAVLRSIFTLGSFAFNDTFIPWKRKQKRYYHAFTKRELQKLVLKSGFTVLRLFEVGKDFIIIAQK